MPCASEADESKGAFLKLAEFVLKLSLEPLLPETKCTATKAQLSVFRVQCGRLMTLNPLAQADFLRCFDQWNREKLTLNPSL